MAVKRGKIKKPAIQLLEPRESWSGDIFYVSVSKIQLEKRLKHLGFPQKIIDKYLK